MTTDHSTDSATLSIDSLIAEANRCLLEFSRRATRQDSILMNELVRAWVSLARATGLSAANDIATTPEQTAHQVKLLFLRRRFLARNCESFRSLPADYRTQIAGLLFKPVL